MKIKSKQSVKCDYLNKARLLLYNKYSNNLDKKYNLLKINEILSNMKSRLVSSFKDFLLYEEDSEFFQRYYNGKESIKRIKKISKISNRNPFIYPNYSSLEEGRYILSNILRKEMLINKNQRNKYHNRNSIRRRLFEENEYFFNNDIYDDIFGKQKSESFINILFGLGNKNNQVEQFEDNEKEELNKIINMIEMNENLSRKKEDKITVKTCVSKKDRIIYNFNKISNKSNKNVRKEYTNIILKDKKELNSDNNYNEETKDNSNSNINSNNYNITPKPTFINNKRMIYHRKLNSSLTCNITKLDLPSSSNIVNILKISNQTKKHQNVLKELFIKNKNENKNNKKIEIKKLPKEKEDKNFIINKYEFISKKNLHKLTRNNQSNNNNENNKVLHFENKSVYIKNKVIKNNMSKKNIFSNANNECKTVMENKRKFIKPYSKPKCIYNDNNKYNVNSSKTFYNQKKEIICIGRLK